MSVDEKVGDVLRDSPARGRHSVDIIAKREENRRGKEAKSLTSSTSDVGNRRKDEIREYKKRLRPILWLSPNFPLKTEELIPLLDILASKVKVIRRLRELFTTKLPKGTFPVKIAIPVNPTIRMIVTFTKFEELQPLDEFSTPPSSPNTSGGESPSLMQQPSSSSWFQWMKTPYNAHASSSTGGSSRRIDNVQDLFMIPADYTSITAEVETRDSFLMSFFMYDG